MINKKEKAMLEADVLNEMFDKFARFADEATDGASSIQIRKLEKDEEVKLYWTV